MGTCCQLIDNPLMTTMDAIKDAHGQPGILQSNFIKRAIMLHMAILLCSAFYCSLGAYDYSVVKNTFFGCQAGAPSSPVTHSIKATNSPCVLTPRTRCPIAVSGSAFT